MTYIVGCRCVVVQQGGLILGLSLQGSSKVKNCESFLSTEGSLKVEIKNTCLILLSHSMNDEKLPYLGLCL